jgi:hypothetical protein
MPLSPAGVVARLSSTPLRNLFAAIVGGVIAGTVEYAVMKVNLPGGVPPIVDAGIVATITAAMLFIVLREWRVRRQLVLQQLHIVAELNHNVRNALQMLLYYQFLPPQKQTEAVLESVNRIDSTLTELFPVIGELQGPVPQNVHLRGKPPHKGS